jgi:hypothetical protein
MEKREQAKRTYVLIGKALHNCYPPFLNFLVITLHILVHEVPQVHVFVELCVFRHKFRYASLFEVERVELLPLFD